MARKEFTARPYQDIIIDFMESNDRAAVWAGMGLGKLQPVDEPVLTANGWAPIGTLVVGDSVIGKNGKPTRVTGVFPQGRVANYKVHFNDGSWTRCGLEHLWSVSTPKHRGRYQTLSTGQLLARGLQDKTGNNKWSIPVIDPVDNPSRDLKIEPYLMGVLLGDGHLPLKGTVSITSDVSILDNWNGRRQTHHSKDIETLFLTGNSDLLRALEHYGLRGKRSWEKSIPVDYLYGSVAQRLSILQGLLDTDGRAMKSGGVEFSSTSENLVDGVVELTESLGGSARKQRARVTRHQNGHGRPSWRVNVKLPISFNPFRLGRKLRGYVRPTKYQVCRVITRVEYDGVHESVCIAVDAVDRLYVTRRHIVTHNTTSALTAIDRMNLSGYDRPTLVLAPLLVAKTTWPDEALKWAHLRHARVVPIVGDESARLRAVKLDASVYTTNYENLPWLVEYFGDRWPFERVIADESTRLKSFRLRQGGVRAQALAKVAHTKIKQFIELTGTPSPNGLIDLWGQIWMLDAGRRLGRSFTAFKQRWFTEITERHLTIPHEHAAGEIHKILGDICLTINSKDWFDLKDPIVTNVKVKIEGKARRLYDDMEKKFFIELEGHEVEAFHAASRSQKLLQMANGAIYVDPLVETDDDPKSKEFKEVHEAKLQALDSIISEANGAPVLVAYNFKSDLARLKKAFPKGVVLNPADVRETMRAWNSGKISVLFAHPASAGHGLNLQDGGNILVFFGLNWNLEHRLQIIERIGPVRQLQAGHDRPVFIYNIIAEDTVDELVLARVETKREVQDLLLEAMARRKR